MYFFFCFKIIGYVQDIKQLLFSMTKQERDDIRAKYKAKIPNPLNHQFAVHQFTSSPERNSKDTAIRRHEARKELQTELFPSGKVITKKFENPCVLKSQVYHILGLT